MKVKEYKFDNCTIEIHDDYLVDETRKKEILENAGKIVSRALERQLMDNQRGTA